MHQAKKKLWFNVAAKSVMADPFIDDGMPSINLAERIAPQGSNYHYRRDFILDDDDWVIYGVASTNDVDLVGDVVDAEEVFSDSLEEFVNTGRIFWEHGYKLAGKVDANNPVTVSIGVPYLAEIYNNELIVYVVLDKTHPTSQMVWERASQRDKRFAKGIGMSIGALPQGKSVEYRDPVTGNYVRKCPKMRLYEVSVTSQPINPYTWTEVVKSFLAEELSEENMRKNAKAKTKAMDEEVAVEEGFEEPTAPAIVEDDSVVNAPDEDMVVDEAVEASMGDDGGMGDPMAAEGDPMLDAGMDMSMGGDEAGMEGDLGDGDDGGMLDLLGDDPLEEEEGDISTDVIHDKVDLLTSQVAEILEILNSESDALGVEDALADSPIVDETPAPEGEELTDVDENADTVFEEEDEEEEEEDELAILSKSFAAQADKAELIFEAVKHLPELVRTIKAMQAQIDVLVESESVPSVRKSAAVRSSNDIAAEREKYEATTKSLKSLRNTEEVRTGVTGSGRHPGMESQELDGTKAAPARQDDEAVLKSVLSNDKQTDLLAELVSTYNSLYGAPMYVAERRSEIYEIADEAFGMSRKAFLKAVSMVRDIK